MDRTPLAAALTAQLSLRCSGLVGASGVPAVTGAAANATFAVIGNDIIPGSGGSERREVEGRERRRCLAPASQRCTQDGRNEVMAPGATAASGWTSAQVPSFKDGKKPSSAQEGRRPRPEGCQGPERLQDARQ